MPWKPLPIGIDNFEDLIRNGYYYVDKTWFIKELWEKKGKVNLFTRPRRFGKTLNMSMLQYFFENTGDTEKNRQNKELFTGFRVMNAGNELTSQMQCFPVINLTFKSSKQADFDLSAAMIIRAIAKEFRRHSIVLNTLTGTYEERFRRIMDEKGDRTDYLDALAFLSDVLMQYYGKKVIILIDEYDVPLENAYYGAFYEEMICFIRSLFESALKTNPCLEFAVITGCLRISKESIFTGLNNLNVISILSNQYDEYFGFSQEEVNKLLYDYNLEKDTGIVKKWYDGYLFGECHVYNPWSVINYIAEAKAGNFAFPKPYWSNTSSNSIVKDLVERSDLFMRQQLEELLSGGVIEKPIHEDITYDTIYDSEENLWSFLFFTGYLKNVSFKMVGREPWISLAIPNEEVAYIYDNTIRSWFLEKVKISDLSQMYTAIMSGNAEIFQKELSSMLQKTISYMDSQENFYHGFLLGILGNMKEHIVKSNRESGNGRLDISIRSLNVAQPPAILELKVSPTFKGMSAACEDALRQIEEKSYDNWLPEEGYSEVWHYGISFFKKQCQVKVRHKYF